MDGQDDSRWLTYDEIATARGTSKDAAVRWTQRRRLRRQPGNDGRVRVHVPDVDLLRAAPLPPTADSNHDVPSVVPTDVPTDVLTVVPALQAAIDTLRAELVRADGREDRLRAAAEQADARAQAAQEAVRKAEEAVQELRYAEEVRKARGRLRRAWDGWRGR